MITDEGKKSGVSIVPSTPVSAIEMVLDEVDLVLVMSVNPGFGGQKFIPSSLEKIRQLDTIRRERGLDFKISVDGGVGLANGKMLIDSGVDVLVMGSAFFGSSDKQALVAKLQGLDD
jgi:ribulose-phosphate 3-epimerase